MNINKLRLKDRKKYLSVNLKDTDDDFLDYIAAQLSKGIDIIELKCDMTKPKKLLDCGKKIRELCSIYNALFMINDRTDIAMLLDADGTVTDLNGIPAEQIKELTGYDKITGLYVKKEDDIISNLSRIDYIISDNPQTEQNYEIPYFIPENKNDLNAAFYRKKE